MKTGVLIAILSAAVLVLAGAFAALLYFFAAGPARDPAVLEEAIAVDDAPASGERPLATDAYGAMRLDLPGVQRTRQNLDAIQRGREQMADDAGEFAPERY